MLMYVDGDRVDIGPILIRDVIKRTSDDDN